MKNIIFYKGIDWISILLCIIIIFFGIINIYSVNSIYGLRQLYWFIFSILIIINLIFISYNTNMFQTYSIIWYIVSIILLLGLIFFGKEINGAKAWYKFGPVSLQPVEFSKIATALFLSDYIEKSNCNLNSLYSICKVTLIILFPIFLIMLQPDLGSVIIFIAFIIPLYREGLNYFIIIFFISLILVFLFSIFVPTYYVLIIINFIILLISIIICIICNNLYIKIYLYYISIFIFLFVINILLLYLINYNMDKDSYYIFFSNIFTFNIMFYSFILIVLTLIFFFLLKKIICIYFDKTMYSVNYKLIFFMIFIISLFTSISFFSKSIFNKLPKHQKERVMILYEGEFKYRNTSGYNLLYSKTAISSGEIYGKGYNKGTIKKGRFVPEQQTDYIFTNIAEEWGFLGSSFIIIIYSIFIARLYYLSEMQKDKFSRFYGYSVSSIILFHFILNISMVMGLFPTIGIPLPLFSYGGSSFTSFLVLISILFILNYRNNVIYN